MGLPNSHSYVCDFSYPLPLHYSRSYLLFRPVIALTRLLFFVFFFSVYFPSRIVAPDNYAVPYSRLLLSFHSLFLPGFYLFYCHVLPSLRHSRYLYLLIIFLTCLLFPIQFYLASCLLQLAPTLILFISIVTSSPLCFISSICFLPPRVVLSHLICPLLCAYVYLLLIAFFLIYDIS